MTRLYIITCKGILQGKKCSIFKMFLGQNEEKLLISIILQLTMFLIYLSVAGIEIDVHHATSSVQIDNI